MSYSKDAETFYFVKGETELSLFPLFRSFSSMKLSGTFWRSDMKATGTNSQGML